MTTQAQFIPGKRYVTRDGRHAVYLFNTGEMPNVTASYQHVFGLLMEPISGHIYHLMATNSEGRTIASLETDFDIIGEIP